jgi:DNA polymerase III epsilon subunit family exonuclease
LIWHELGPFTVFDVETTGMSPTYDRIVELAAIRVEVDGSMQRFQTLIHPGRPIPPGVTEIHHITDEMVKDSPNFKTAITGFLDLAQESTLVAHNARFDLGFLQESLARNGMQLWQGKTLDSLRLLRNTHPRLPSYSLQNLRAYFQLPSEENMTAHRAGADVEWTVQLLEIALNSAINRNSKR